MDDPAAPDSAPPRLLPPDRVARTAAPATAPPARTPPPAVAAATSARPAALPSAGIARWLSGRALSGRTVAGRGGRPGWWESWSLRARLTVVATALLGAGLAAAAVLLTITVARSMQTALDTSALENAAQVAALANAGRLPDPVPVGSVSTAVVQVVDSQGRIRAASAGADRLVSVLAPDQLARARTGERLYVRSDSTGDSWLRVVAVPAGTTPDPLTVVVAVDVSVVRDSIRLLRNGVLLGAPLLLVLGGLVSWRVIGWTLRPVEQLRRGAAEISGTGAGRAGRLPVPDTRDELQRLALTLNDMLARLAAGSARQRAFVSDAAHELRSPIASIRTQVEVAAQLGGPELTELADEVLIDVDRLTRLVDDLLLLARLDEAVPPGTQRRPERVDVRELASEAVRGQGGGRVPVWLDPPATSPPGPDRSVLPGGETGPVSPDPPSSPRPDRPVVLADPDALHRVLANLLDNAVRHAESAVHVQVVEAAGVVEITVVDDGPGIPVTDRGRVFDRFTRLDSARGRAAGGAGLGLAIVKEIVRAHRGVVALGDAGPGLRVTVTLPAAGRFAVTPRRTE